MDVVHLLGLALAVVVAGGLLVAFGRWPKAAVAGSLALPLTTYTYLPLPSLYVGATSVHLVDVVDVCLLLVAAKRLAERRVRLSAPAFAVAGLLVVEASLAVAGAWGHSLDSSFNEFRGMLQPLPLALFVVVCFRGEDDVDWLASLWAWWALLLSAVSVLHWAQYGIGTSSEMLVVAGQQVSSRGLMAAGAWDVAAAVLLLVFARRPVRWSDGRRRLVAGWLVLVVVLLQQRTVWVALVAAAVVGVAVSRRRPWVLVGLGSAVYAGVTAVLGLWVTGSSVLTDLDRSWREAFQPHSTAQWRIAGWQELLHTQLVQWQHWVFGRPFGLGYARVVNGELVTVAPHSYYVQVLLRGGLVGLVLVVLAYLGVSWALVRAPGDLRGLSVLVVAELAYLVAYPLDFEHGVVLGLCLTAAAGVQRSQVRSRPRTTGSDQDGSMVKRRMRYTESPGAMEPRTVVARLRYPASAARASSRSGR